MRLRVAIVALGFAVLPGEAALANEAVGVWLTDEGKARVRLTECGENRLCSEIIWLREATDENGRPIRDQNNPDPKLRNRPIMGLEILQGLTRAGSNEWAGLIYNPENGKMYRAHLTVGPESMQLKGCLMMGWPCGAQSWTRVKESRATQQVARASAPAAQVPQAAAPQPRAPEPQSRQVSTFAPVDRANAAERPAAAGTTGATGSLPPAAQPAQPQAQQQAALAQPQARPAPAAALPWQSDGDDYLIQIAARQTQDEALVAFAELQRRYPDLLGNYQPLIQMADLGVKGIWYRVRVGPIDRKAEASALCDRLKMAGGDCIVRRLE